VSCSPPLISSVFPFHVMTAHSLRDHGIQWMPHRYRRWPLIQTRAPALHSSSYALARLGPHQTDYQVLPVHLPPGVLVVELRPCPVGLQAAMLLGVEQAVEVEARCSLVLGL
jgi:hypothetical protein